MKRITKTLTVATLLTAGTAALAGFGLSNTTATTETTELAQRNIDAQAYQVDLVHSSLLFKIRHSGLAYFYGHFDDFTGSIEIDPSNIEAAQLSFTVDTASVDSNNAKRDEHIRTADFFNARQYPKATFTSTGVKQITDGVYELTGEFDFHGVTKPVTAKLTDLTFGEQRGNDAVGFHAVFTIERSKFGIMKYVNPEDPENGPLGDKVEIIVSIEAVSS